MISLVKDECVDKYNWVSSEEFLNVIAIAESTPGPIAINMATYIGYKKKKFIGAFIATLGVVLPSLIVICLIANYLKDFLNIKFISDAFFGIRIAVSMVIIRTAYKLIKDEYKKNKHKNITIILFIIYTLVLFYTDVNNINLSSVLLILSAIIIGVILLILKVDKNDDIL